MYWSIYLHPIRTDPLLDEGFLHIATAFAILASLIQPLPAKVISPPCRRTSYACTDNLLMFFAIRVFSSIYKIVIILEKVKEVQILKKILQRCVMDEESTAKVTQVARNAYRDYWYRKQLLQEVKLLLVFRVRKRNIYLYISLLDEDYINLNIILFYFNVHLIWKWRRGWLSLKSFRDLLRNLYLSYLHRCLHCCYRSIDVCNTTIVGSVSFSIKTYPYLQSLKETEEPWEVAAQRTLNIYKRTKPSFDELTRATKKIQVSLSNSFPMAVILIKLPKK